MAFSGDFGSGQRFTLGEKKTELTGGWDDFRDERIGLARELSGRYRLCIIGMGGGGVFNLDSFVLSDAPGTHDGITQAFDVRDEVLEAGGHSFRLEKVAEIDGEFWSVDFLDARTLLATQKSGTLWRFRGGKDSKPARLSDDPEPDRHRNILRDLGMQEGRDRIHKGNAMRRSDRADRDTVRRRPCKRVKHRMRPGRSGPDEGLAEAGGFRMPLGRAGQSRGERDDLFE